MKHPALPLIPAGFAFSEGGCIELACGPGDADSLTLDSAQDRLRLGGAISITRDRQGLALAHALLQVLEQSVQVLQADEVAGRLPEAVALEKPIEHDNPFA